MISEPPSTLEIVYDLHAIAISYHEKLFVKITTDHVQMAGAEVPLEEVDSVEVTDLWLRVWQTLPDGFLRRHESCYGWSHRERDWVAHQIAEAVARRMEVLDGTVPAALLTLLDR